MGKHLLFTIALAVASGTSFSQPCDTSLAKHYYSLAESFRKKQHEDSAFIYYQRGGDLFGKCERWQEQANCFNQMSEICWKRNQLEVALEFAQSALAISTKKQGTHNSEKAFACFNLATAYYYQGDFLPSLEYYKIALAEQQKVSGDQDPKVAAGFNAVGYLYWKLGNFREALDYFKKSMTLRKQHLGKDHAALIDSYTNIGVMYRNMGMPDQALEYHFKAMALVEKLRKGPHPDLAMCYDNIGGAYCDKKEYSMALKYMLDACAIARRLLGDHCREITYGYDNLARTYRLMGDSSNTEYYLHKSLSIRSMLYAGRKHPELGESYRDLAQFYIDKKRLKRGAQFFHKSILATLDNFYDSSLYCNPRLADCQAVPEVLYSLQGKADALAQLYTKYGTERDVVTSLNTYYLADSLADDLKFRKPHDDDKLALAKFMGALYEGAIEQCISLYKTKKDKRYLERAFYFSEKSKANVLSQALAHTSALGMSLVPNALNAFERNLRNDKAITQSKIFYFKKADTPNLDTIEFYESKLFGINRKSDSLINALERNYPAYYNLKYHRTARRIDSVQHHLPEKTALIEFFEGEEQLYTFVITKNTYEVYYRPVDATYLRLFDQLNTGLTIKGKGVSPLTSWQNFVSSSEKLYSILLSAPLRDAKTRASINKIIFIPDGRLSSLPFEILLTRYDPTSTGPGDYGNLDYLLRAYSVRYGYSASLLFDSPIQKPNATKGKNILSFAPSYESANADSTSLLISGESRETFVPLLWNQREVANISKIAPGKSYLGTDATESRFKSEAHNYQVIHLAMHAFTDDQEPLQSKLVFSRENNSLEDGYLHAFELYEQKLAASLVVLSACNTGGGRIMKGEGTMSLARAFAYAGVPSVVMSHWNVDDAATSKLMQYFYERLAEGETKDDALRGAKLQYLSTSTPSGAHPIYWAAFTLTGYNDAIIERSSFGFAVPLGIALLISISVVVVLRSTIGRSKK
jgi:CHAT domain-containing protein/tetratricopeptide (TPR) repeat protein